MRVSLLLCSIVLVTPLVAETCAATPEAAARAALGGPPSEAVSTAGYRVEDVQVDPVLRRVWIRVMRCGGSSAPAILVPLVAPLRIAANPTDAASPAMGQQASSSSSMHVGALAPVTPVVIHFGDAVRAVFTSASVHMELDAIADQQGRVGETIAFTVKQQSGPSLDEPEHRIHGIVRADKTVEVTP